MTQISANFDPLWFFRLPGSGNVRQNIATPWFSPTVNVNYAGDPVIEERVVTDVASFGRQIGWLSELVVALANKKPFPADALKKLEAAAAQIKAIKDQRQHSARELVEEGLDRLERDQPDEYKRLIAKLLRDRRSRED